MFYFLLVCNMLIPLTMLIGGWVMWKHPPREINMLYGYRTARSTRNMDTWHFANTYCGRLWWRWGWILALLSALAHLPFIHADEETLGVLCIAVMAVQLAVLFISIIFTERALKRTFREDGTRK